MGNNMDNNNPGWLNNLTDFLHKKAIDKLPDEEISSKFPPKDDDSVSADPAAADPNAMPPGADGSQPPIDPSQISMPPGLPPEEKPKVFDNQYLVNCDNTKFIVELTPSIVMDPGTDPSAMPPDGLQQGTADPMSDTSLNPDADPQKLKDWMKESDDNDKPYQHNEQGTVDPLSKKEEGISDVGNEQSVKVHNKANLKNKLMNLFKQADTEGSGIDEASSDKVSPTKITPGADRSNAYPPCKFCANYNAADNTCSQGLDVEKVQAAKSCSWLNSTMQPFNSGNKDDAYQDKETVNSDINSANGQGGNNQTKQNFTASKNDKLSKDKLKDVLGNKFWD